MTLSLGIDPSLTGFGWVVHDPTVIGLKRVIAKGVISTPASELFITRYIYLRTQLVYILADFPEVLDVGVESPPFGEQFSEGLYALFTHVNEAIYLSRRNVVYFDPLTVKLLAKMNSAVIQGTMDKSCMVEAAKADTGITEWNHNVADAYLIARSAARFWMFERGLITPADLTPSEEHSFNRVKTYTRGAKAGTTKQLGLVFREGDRYFKFSQLPTNPIEVEYIQWLLKNSQRSLKSSMEETQSPLQRDRPAKKPRPKVPLPR